MRRGAALLLAMIFLIVFSTMAVGWNSATFDPLSGWGKIDLDILQSDAYDNLNIIDQTTIFHAVNETDIHNRFSDETWSRSWKFSTIGINDPNDLKLILEGINKTEARKF